MRLRLRRTIALRASSGGRCGRSFWRGAARWRRPRCLAREAVALADETDFTVLRGDAFMDLADVLRTAGRETESTAFAKQALELYEQKGNVVAVERARRILDA